MQHLKECEITGIPCSLILQENWFLKDMLWKEITCITITVNLFSNFINYFTETLSKLKSVFGLRRGYLQTKGVTFYSQLTHCALSTVFFPLDCYLFLSKIWKQKGKVHRSSSSFLEFGGNIRSPSVAISLAALEVKEKHDLAVFTIPHYKVIHIFIIHFCLVCRQGYTRTFIQQSANDRIVSRY